MGLRLTYRGRITVTYVDFERFGAQGGWSRGVADAGRGRRDAEPPQRATRDAVRRATLPDIWRWGSGKPPLQWHETHQLNGRVILSTRGGDVRRYPRRATAATRKSGRGAQVIMSGALGFTGGSSAITTGTNPCAGIGQRKRLDGAHACSARQWRTFSSGDQTSNALRDRLWCLVERTPNLDWLLLTKRPELARRLTPWRAAWPSNVWLGTTVENQHFADQRIDEYIHLFLVVTKHGVYLDLFAGPQRASDTTNWSVRRVLDRRSVGNPAIHHYAVCDSDSRKAQRLRDLGQRHPSFCVYEGDVNRLVKRNA